MILPLQAITDRAATDRVVVIRHVDGTWLLGAGYAFPSVTDIPNGALFWRMDLAAFYKWVLATHAWTAIATAGGGDITIAEADGAPTGSFTELRVDSVDGLVLTDLGGGVARFDLSAVPESVLSLNFPTHSSANDPSAGEKAALAGTSGTPGVGNEYVTDDDPRNSNARTPTAHATSHQNSGADEISVVGLSGLLADNQTPSTHDIITKHNGFPGGGTTFLRDDGTFAAPSGGGGDSITINGAALVDADFDDATPAPPAGEVNVKWQKDGASPANVSASVQAATTVVKGVVELATDGEAAAGVVVQGNDARMSNARTPTAHAASHQNAGGDEISVVGLSGLLADDQTPLTHDIITKHNGFPGGTSTFLRADGTFAAPPGGAGASWTEVEVDFGTKPVKDALFTITDAAIGPTSKLVIAESGKAATGRAAGDAQWDSIACSALSGTGSATVYAMAHPGPVVGKRTLHYCVAA